jgi:hypothetical protein
MNSPLVTIYDSAAGMWPLDTKYALVYIDGQFSQFAAAKKRIPKAWLIQATVEGQPGVALFDCENAGQAFAAVTWAAKEVAINRRPTIYCNRTTRPTVAIALSKLGLSFVHDVDWFCANPDGVAEVPAGAVAKQYRWGPSAGALSFDVSVALPSWAALRPGDK